MYYNIEFALEPKVIGVKNGPYQVELDKKNYTPKSYELFSDFFITKQLSTKQEYPDFDFSFCFKAFKSTKKTDFMSFTPYLNNCQFLIRGDVFEIMKKFNIQPFKEYPVIIYDSKGESPDTLYRMFYSVLQDWNVIDFENTVFTTGGYGNIPLTEHSFANENEFVSFNKITDLKKLSLSKDFDTSLDYFKTRLGGNFVSERLKKALEENNVTGVNFIDKKKLKLYKE